MVIADSLKINSNPNNWPLFQIIFLDPGGGSVCGGAVLSGAILFMLDEMECT